MPRPTRAQKKGTNLHTEGQPTQVRVTQHQRLYGPRGADTRGIQQFLGNLSQFAERREAKRNRDLADRGALDAATGEVDEDLMNKSAYADAVNTTNGTADAVSLRARVKAEMERDFLQAREEGREWDSEEAYQRFTQEFLESPAFGNEAYRRGTAEELLKLRAEMSAFGARETAKAQLQEGYDSVARLAFSQFSSGEFNAEALEEAADFLPTNERAAAVAEGALSFLAQATSPDDLEAVDSWVSTLSPGQKQKIGDEIANARRVADARVNKLSAEDKLNIERRNESAKRGLWLKADRGELDWEEAQVLEAEGVISPEELTSFFKQNVNALEKLQKEAEDDIEKTQFMEFSRTVFENPTSFAGLDTTTRNKVKDAWEESQAEASGQLMQFAAAFVRAEEAGDEGQIIDLRDQMLRGVGDLKPYVENSRAMGFTPRWLKNYIGAAVDPSSPQFRAAAEVVTVLQAEYGDDVFSDVAEEPLAKIDAYRSLRNAGMDSQQATDLLASRAQITLPEARSALRADSKFKTRLDRAVENLVEDQEFNTGYIFDTDAEVTNGSYVKDVVSDLAAIHYRTSGNAEAAVEWGRGQFQKSHQLIDGAWMPTEGIPRGFGMAFHENRDKVLKSMRSKGLLADDENFQLLPLEETGATGRVGVFRKKEGIASGLYPVRDSGGHPIEVDPFKLLANVGVILDEARREEGAEVLTEARALRKSRQDALLNQPPIQPK